LRQIKAVAQALDAHLPALHHEKIGRLALGRLIKQEAAL